MRTEEGREVHFIYGGATLGQRQRPENLISVVASGEIYLTPGDARAFALHLNAAADEMDHQRLEREADAS